MDKHQATVINPIFLRCVLSTDGLGPGDRDEPHFFYDVLPSSDGQGPGDKDEPHFFLRCVLSTDGQAPGDGEEPHYLEEDCHMRDEYPKMVIDSIFF